MDPGHKDKFNNLFTRIETLYPRKNVNKTIDNARKIQQTQQKYGVYGKDDPKSSVFNRPKSGVQRQSNSQARQNSLPGKRGKSREKSTTRDNSNSQTREPKFKTVEDQRETSRERDGSTSKERQNSLSRKFHALDEGTRAAINESFLTNVKPGSGKRSKMTVNDAVKEFFGKDAKSK